MSEIFREVEVTIDDKKTSIKKEPIKNIFKFNSPPYIVVGATNSGKTTLCLDIIKNFSEECTKIYYVTSTEDNLLNEGKPGNISLIPKVFRRKPTYETIHGIWEDLTRELVAHHYDPNKYIKVLKKLWNESENTDLQTVLKELEDRKESIRKKQENYYKNKKINDLKSKELSTDDSNAFYCECLTRLLVDSASQNDTSKLTLEEMLMLNSLISPKPKNIFILDDVTAELNSLSTQRRTVHYKNSATRVGEAYKNILIDILTRGRHTGSLICMFLHMIDIIPKDQISNLILLDDSSVQKVINSRTFPQDMKKNVISFSSYVFKPEFRYHFLYINRGEQRYCVGKAEIVSDSLEFSDTNTELIKAYDLISQSLENEDIDESDESESEDESDDSLGF